MFDSSVQPPSSPTTPSPMPETPQSTKSSYHPHIIGFVTLIVIFGLGYFFGTKQLNHSEPIPSPAVSASPVISPDPTANWKTYKNDEQEFELRYPDEWFLAESRIQNYDPESVSGLGRGYSSERDKGLFAFIFDRWDNQERGGLVSVAVLKNLLEIEDKQECLYYGDPSGIKIAKEEKENKLNGLYLFSRITKCEQVSDMAWTEEYYTLDGSGRVVYFTPILDVSSEREMFNQILSTFKFMD